MNACGGALEYGGGVATVDKFGNSTVGLKGFSKSFSEIQSTHMKPAINFAGF